MDKSHKKAEKLGGGEYLTQLRMAIDHVRAARKCASHGKGGANRLIFKIERHIRKYGEQS